jgi:hypothetical protein
LELLLSTQRLVRSTPEVRAAAEAFWAAKAAATMVDMDEQPEAPDPPMPLLRFLSPDVMKVERNPETRFPEVVVREGELAQYEMPTPGEADTQLRGARRKEAGVQRISLELALSLGLVAIADEPIPFE